MKLELNSEKLRAATVSLIDTGDGVVVKRGRVEIKIAGEDAGKVVNMILAHAQNGTSREELAGLFAPPERPTVEALLDHLIGRRILALEDDLDSTDAPDDSHVDIFYWHFGIQTKQVRQRLNGKRIRIFGVNYISRQLARGLRASGADEFEVVDFPLLRNQALFDTQGNLKEKDWSADSKLSSYPGDLDPESLDCLVATSDSGAIDQLRAWNEFCVLHNIIFLPVLLQDLVGYVGPIVAPGQTPCFECLRSRQNAHMLDYGSRRAVEAAFLQEQAVGGFHPSMASILGDVAAMELTKYFGLGEGMARTGVVIEVNLLGSEMKARRVLKLPRCPVCSRLNQTPAAALTRSMLLGPNGGGDR